MPNLMFQILSARGSSDGTGFVFRLAVSQSDTTAQIRSIALRCQIRIEPARRKYSALQQQRLGDLFGEPHRWGQTVRSMLWTNTALSVPSFTDSVEVDLPITCAADDAASKYFDALDDGEIPLTFLFSGTIFYTSRPQDPLQIAMISHDTAASFRLIAGVPLYRGAEI
jgi:hypothetical protein